MSSGQQESGSHLSPFHHRVNFRAQTDELEVRFSPPTNQGWSHGPTRAYPYNFRGVARQERGDFEGALADYSEAIRLQPQYATAYYHRGVLKELQGNYTAAIADYQNYLKYGIGKERAELSAVMDKVVELRTKL